MLRRCKSIRSASAQSNITTNIAPETATEIIGAFAAGASRLLKNWSAVQIIGLRASNQMAGLLGEKARGFHEPARALGGR